GRQGASRARDQTDGAPLAHAPRVAEALLHALLGGGESRGDRRRPQGGAGEDRGEMTRPKTVENTGPEVRREEPTLGRMLRYFLRLGALGFGGPVALANSMRRDLVETRGWLTETEYDRGLAIAAACPGPLAYQLGVYCGYVRHGLAGGLGVAAAF